MRRDGGGCLGWEDAAVRRLDTRQTGAGRVTQHSEYMLPHGAIGGILQGSPDNYEHGGYSYNLQVVDKTDNRTANFTYMQQVINQSLSGNLSSITEAIDHYKSPLYYFTTYWTPGQLCAQAE